MPGSRNLVVFLGVALVIARYWTSAQRSVLSLSSFTGGQGPTNTTGPGGTNEDLKAPFGVCRSNKTGAIVTAVGPSGTCPAGTYKASS